MGCGAGRCNKDVINNLPHKKLCSAIAKYSDFFFFFFFFYYYYYYYYFFFFDALKTGKNE